MNSQKQATHSSRWTSVYDHCGKKMKRHNFKKHVQDLHPGMPVRERVVGLMSFGQFVLRMSNNKNNDNNNN